MHFERTKLVLQKIMFKDVRGWQFLTIEAAETLCMVCVPPEEHILRKNIWVIDLSKNHIL